MIIYFKNYKKNNKKADSYALDWESVTNNNLHPQIKTWAENTDQEKIEYLLKTRSYFDCYVEYVSNQRYFKIFDPSIIIDPYELWIKKLVEDKKV